MGKHNVDFICPVGDGNRLRRDLIIDKAEKGYLYM
jgi:hypothetical protein